MVTAEELTVAIKSEGVGETQQDLEGVERAMENTADSAGDSADELEGFSERFQGAMSAAVAALAIGAAGLLANVPVLGEAFAGLGAIVSALAFQVDSVLRPALQPLTNFFFSIAQAIFEADGAFGSLIGVVTTLVSVVTALIPVVAQVGVLLGKWSSVGSGVSSILSAIVSGISSFVSAAASFVAGSTAAAAALGAFIGTLGVALLEVTGVLDAVRGFGEFIASALPSQVATGMNALIGLFAGPLAVIGGLIVGFVKGFLDGGLSEGVDRAVATGKRVLSTFVQAWQDTLSNIGTLVSDIVAVFTDLGESLSGWAGNVASDAYQWGQDIIQQIIDGINSLIGELRDRLNSLRESATNIEINAPDLGIGGGGGGGGGDGGGGGPLSGINPFSGGGGGGNGSTQIDGRQLSESTGRYRADPGRRRGL